MGTPNTEDGRRADAVAGAVMLGAALAALAWANSPWQASYASLWGTDVTIGLSRLSLGLDLRHWVNDALMTVFFLVVGLEIKRELVQGELRQPRVAAMPVIAALGGMVVPAVLFVLCTASSGTGRGWGIPMATDIAFALAVLAVLGPRIPPALRLFVLTFAVADDIGAIAVIAVFYASDIRAAYLAGAVVLLAAVLALRRAGVVTVVPYAVVGIGVWLAMQASGVHPTVAGVALGLLAPASRVERLEGVMRPWTSFLVVPVFALANAGVTITADSLGPPGAATVAAGVVVGLVVGKVVGITAATWLAVRTGLGRLPEGTTWPMVAAVGVLGGLGFTVALFVAELAYAPGPVQDAARLGVLAASTTAAVVGGLCLRRATADRA